MNTELPIDQKLLSLARDAAIVFQELRDLLRDNGPGSQCILDEKEAFEELEESIQALSKPARTLAMRFNRAALIEFES